MNINNKIWPIVLMIIVILFGLWFIWNFNNPDNNPKVIKVGVSQITSHAVFDEIKKGIISSFNQAGYVEGENIFFDFQNAQGDGGTNAAIAQKFANSDYHLFIPLGTPASQALANLIKDRPIIFGAVTDPLTAGLVQSNENPGANITGTSDITLYKEHLELLKQLTPRVKKVGLIHNPGEANSKYAIEKTREIGELMGFEFVTAPANNSGEILIAARSIVNKVDAFYVLPDNTVLAGQDALIKVAMEAKKPLIAIDQSGVEKGALATLGTNYEKVGQKTAEIAIRILKGEKPGNIPVLGVTDADLFINKTTAEKIGVFLPQELIDQAKQVYR